MHFLVFLFSSAAEAVSAMGLLSKNPLPSEDRLLVSEMAAASLLSLAAQIALEVWCTGFCSSLVLFIVCWQFFLVCWNDNTSFRLCRALIQFDRGLAITHRRVADVLVCYIFSSKIILPDKNKQTTLCIWLRINYCRSSILVLFCSSEYNYRSFVIFLNVSLVPICRGTRQWTSSLVNITFPNFLSAPILKQ